jgi:hypothetical protein
MPSVCFQLTWSHSPRNLVVSGPCLKRSDFCPSSHLCSRVANLGGANHDADDENEHTAHYDLKGRRKQGGVHVAMANPRDDRKFDCDDGHGDTHRIKEVGNKKGSV